MDFTCSALAVTCWVEAESCEILSTILLLESESPVICRSIVLTLSISCTMFLFSCVKESATNAIFSFCRAVASSELSIELITSMPFWFSSLVIFVISSVDFGLFRQLTNLLCYYCTPRPASPARALSMEAFRDKRFV